MPCLQYNLQKDIHPGATPFSRSKGFRVFLKALVSMQPFPAEELPETVHGLEETLFDRVVNESAMSVLVKLAHGV